MTEWLSSIGPAVGNHLWQSTVFIAVVWVATLLLRRNQAWVRYGLWFAASVKFLIPFSLLVGLGSLLPRPQHVVVAMPFSYAMDTVTQPFTQTPMDFAPVVVQASPVQRFVHMIPLTLVIIWLCGVIVVLAVWGVRWRQVAKTLRQAVRVEGGREWEILRRLHNAMGAGRQIPLLMSQKLMEPGMFGIFRPVLIWPQRLSERLKDEHIEAILAHELGHAQRRDNLTALLHMVVEAAFWFHPLVWWMERRMVEERERACDEAVVQMGSRPGIYAESLLKACRFCVESPLVCVSGITGADLSNRVLSIMTLRLEQMSMGKKIALALFGVLVIATPILLGQSEAAQRVMLAAVNAAPSPFRTAAHAMIAQVSTPSTGLIAKLQSNPEVPYAAPTAASQSQVVPHGIHWEAVRQSDAPAEVCCGGGSFQDVISGARINSNSDKGISYFRLGWAYVRPTGLEFQVGDTIVPYNGMHPHGTFGVEDQRVDSHGELAGVIVFLEQVMLDDGTNWKADHKQIEAYYKSHTGIGHAMQAVGAAEVAQPAAVMQGTGNTEQGTANGAVQVEPQQRQIIILVGPEPAFEVATIKVRGPNTPGIMMYPWGSQDTVSAGGTARLLVARAYGLPATSMRQRVVGGPDWIDKDQFIIQGKIPEELFARMQAMSSAERERQAILMMQSLLVDRCKLKVHVETREMPTYELVVAKNGPKLPPPNAPLAATSDPSKAAADMAGGEVVAPNGVRIRNVTLDGMLQAPWFGLGDRTIVNKTGLTGKYSLTLNCKPEPNAAPRPVGAPPEDPPEDVGQASIFTVLQEQLGLKLVSAVGQVEVLVIDSIERPSAN